MSLQSNLLPNMAESVDRADQAEQAEQATEPPRIVREKTATFGEILDQVHLYGFSKLDPKDMKANCVSVTVAKILGYTDVYALWDKVLGYHLPDRGLTDVEIENLLRKTGLRFVFKTIHDSTSGSGTLMDNEHFLAEMVQWKAERDKVTPTPVTAAPEVKLAKPTTVSKSRTA